MIASFENGFLCTSRDKFFLTHLHSVSIRRTAILSPRLPVIAPLTQCLPVAPIPEDLLVSSVRYDVIHNRKWSMALGSTIYDVCNDVIVRGLLKRYLGSERAAAMQHCSELEALGLFQDAVIIFDRGYYSEDMFRYFSSKGYLCVMRIRERLKISKKCTGDCILTLPGNKKKGTEDIPIRVISVPLDGGETEYLATTIFDESLTSDDFKELYFMH